jgi:integrase
MRKCWLYKRKNRPGWYVHWYDSRGHVRAKHCPNKATANRYARRKEHALNEDLFPDPVGRAWPDLVKEYLTHKDRIDGVKPESLRDIEKTLKTWLGLMGLIRSDLFSRRLVHAFVDARRDAVTVATLNKDLRNLRAMVKWACDPDVRAMDPKLSAMKWPMQKEQKKAPRALSIDEFGQLLTTATDLYGMAWQVRILLAVGTGLRQQDIEQLSIADVHIKSMALSTLSQKTSKSTDNRPIHPTIVKVLKAYIKGLPAGQVALFSDKFHSSKWEKIRDQAKLPGLKYHSLRAAFSSFLALAGFSTSVAQRMLEHSTPNLTHAVYTNVDPAMRSAANAIPIDQALSLVTPSVPQAPGEPAATDEHPTDSSAPPDPCDDTEDPAPRPASP